MTLLRGPTVAGMPNDKQVRRMLQKLLFAAPMQTMVLDRPVVDRTGISGTYDFTLRWTPNEVQSGRRGGRAPPPTDTADVPPDLYTAIQRQLGLKLESTKVPVNVLVIDTVENPSDN